MTDIAKCAGLSANGDPCPQRESCWRWVAPANASYQSYAAFAWDEDCAAYWWTPARREGAAE